MKSSKLLVSSALMALVLGVATVTTHAVSPGPDTDPPPNVPGVSTGTAPGRPPAGAGIRNVGSSTVSGVSPDRLIPGSPFDLCFTVVYQSPDLEYMDGFDVQLPTNWTVNTVYDVPGNGGGYGHTYGVTANKLWWYTNVIYHWGDWSNGAYNFCANVTVPDCSGSPWSLGWNIIGDSFGGAPHSASGSISADCMLPGVYLPIIKRN